MRSLKTAVLDSLDTDICTPQMWERHRRTDAADNIIKEGRAERGEL